jgi:hypothetical protein
MIKNYFFLQKHHQLVSFCMFYPKVFGTGHFIDTLPTTTRMWFHIGRKFYIIKNTLPIRWILQISETIAQMYHPVCLCEGNNTVFGTGTPTVLDRQLLKNFSSALHQKGLLATAVPINAAFFKICSVKRNILRNSIDNNMRIQ